MDLFQQVSTRYPDRANQSSDISNIQKFGIRSASLLKLRAIFEVGIVVSLSPQWNVNWGLCNRLCALRLALAALRSVIELEQRKPHWFSNQTAVGY